jgi:hypothetical protein
MEVMEPTQKSTEEMCVVAIQERRESTTRTVKCAQSREHGTRKDENM